MEEKKLILVYTTLSQSPFSGIKGNLSSDDGNGNENITWKYNYSSFVLLRDYF